MEEQLLGGLKDDTATAILTKTSLIKKYVAAIDKATGEINFLKLGTF